MKNIKISIFLREEFIYENVYKIFDLRYNRSWHKINLYQETLFFQLGDYDKNSY